MEGSKEPVVLTTRIGHLIRFMLVVVAITPLALAVASAAGESGHINWPTLALATIWLCLVVLYRSLADADGARRRRLLTAQIDHASAAHAEQLETFRHRLVDQDVVLDQIVEISDRLITDGITDPQLALRNIRLIQSHTRDARALLEDTLMEVRLDAAEPPATEDTVDLRAEISKVIAACSRPGITTVGAQLFAHTDPAMFRVLVRNLVSGAVDRGADEIDVSVTSDQGTVVCCVSDNGEPVRRESQQVSPALVDALARALGSEIRFARLMRRNQAAFELPIANAPVTPERIGDPLDVLGSRVRHTGNPLPDRPVRAPQGKITFPETSQRRDRPQTAATGREGQPITR